MEAAITLVGFAASLVTLAATVGESARTVHDLWKTVKESPINLKRLGDAIAENEALLKEMQAVSDAYERVGIPDRLISRWKSVSSSAYNDFKELNMEMSKILECAKGDQRTKWHLRRRARHFFSEKALENRCQQLSTHKADMSYIHLLMHSSYTIQIGEKVQSFGPNMEAFRQESLAKLEGLKISLEATQADMVQAVQSELSRFKNCGAIQQAFQMVTDQYVASERPVPASYGNPASPLQMSRITHSQRPCHQYSSGLVHAVEWHSQKYRFPIGTLQVEHVESVDVEIDEREDASVRLVPYRSKKVRFIFEPPHWFSSLVIKIDVAMQIAQHGCTPSITWGSVPIGRHLDPLVDELHQVSNLTLDRKLLAIARIGELDYLFEEIVSYCLGISSSDGRPSQKQRDARPIADALEQGMMSFPGGEVGSRFLDKMATRIGWTENNEALDGEQSRADMHQPLSKSSVMKVDAILSDNARGYLSETQRAVRLTSSLIDSGAHLPASIDFPSILMTDYGLWYLQCICPTLDITEIEDLSLPSQWIFACLVRTVPACYESISRQLQGFPVNALQYYTSAKRLVDEINSSDEHSRHRSLSCISVGGSASMLEALLFHGLSTGDLSTYYLEIATRRGRMANALLLLSYGASLPPETSHQLLKRMKPDLKSLLRDPSRSETFCHFLTQILASCVPFKDIDHKHTIFETLVIIFQEALLLSIEEQDRSTSNSDIVQFLSKYGAFSSPETSTRVLVRIKSHYNRFLRDKRKSKAFYVSLMRVVESCGPLQELDDKHAILECLVLIFHKALLLSNKDQVRSTSKSDDHICNKVVRLLLEAGLFRDSKLPACYWSLHGPLGDGPMNESPLTLAIYMRNEYVIRILLENGYNVDEIHSDRSSSCMEYKGTPLMYAIWLGFLEVVSILLAAGADVTKMGAQGQTAAVFAKICISLPISTNYMGNVEDTGSDRCEDGTSSRRQIFDMVCANLEKRHGMQYEDFFDAFKMYFPLGSRLRSDNHPISSRYWRSFEMICGYCPEEMLGMTFEFAWHGLIRETQLCPCLDCLQKDFESSHAPLPGSWERIVAPCTCSFIDNSRRGIEEAYLSSSGYRVGKLCPSGNGRRCELRVLYMNHVTEEATLHCPCATCSPDWKGVPCITLCSLFNEDEPRFVEEDDDPLIPAQDLTRVGEPCWRLGDLFNDDMSDNLEHEDDPIIPAQDVGLSIFDDMPGFALAKNHRASATQDPLMIASTQKSQSLTAEDSDLGTPDSRSVAAPLQKPPTTAVSTPSFSLFVSRIVTRSTPFTHTPRSVTLREVLEISLGLSLSVLLILIYECISVYTYLKDLPRPPPFLSKLALLVLVALGLRALKGNFGLV